MAVLDKEKQVIRSDAQTPFLSTYYMLALIRRVGQFKYNLWGYSLGKDVF